MAEFVWYVTRGIKLSRPFELIFVEFINDMVMIILVTITSNVNNLLSVIGLRKKSPHMNGLYGANYDSESRIDDDNQLIDDIEEDRW